MEPYRFRTLSPEMLRGVLASSSAADRYALIEHIFALEERLKAREKQIRDIAKTVAKCARFAMRSPDSPPPDLEIRLFKAMPDNVEQLVDEVFDLIKEKFQSVISA